MTAVGRDLVRQIIPTQGEAAAEIERLSGALRDELALTVTVGPRNAYTDPQSGLRFYRWKGRDLPSVTSIRRMAGIPHGLHQWSLGKVIDYALDHLPDIVRRVAQPDGAAQVKVIRTELRGAATAERDAAAALGTAVHDAASSGKALTDVGPAIAPRLRQYQDWLAVSGAEILGSEFQVFNLTVGYAGTADLLVRLKDGSIWLVDLKTGKGTYAEFELQVLAYMCGEFVGEDDQINEPLTQLLLQATGGAILHLADDHWEFRALEVGEERLRAIQAFYGLLAFATWMHEHQSIDTVTTALRRSA